MQVYLKCQLSKIGNIRLYLTYFLKIAIVYSVTVTFIKLLRLI